MLTVMVSDTDDVIKAEIIQALKIIRYHQSSVPVEKTA
jgi:hypothetical protein